MAQGVTRQSHVRTGRGGPHGPGHAPRVRNQAVSGVEISHGAKRSRTSGAATDASAKLTHPSPYEDAVAITGISAANPCVITATTNVEVGDEVRIEGVLGQARGGSPEFALLEPDMFQLNGRTYAVTVVPSGARTSFTIDFDTRLYSAYGSAGTVKKVRKSIPTGTEPYGPGD